MRALARATAVVLAVIALASAALALWLLSDGYEPEAPHFVGSLFMGGAVLVLLVAGAIGWLVRRR